MLTQANRTEEVAAFWNDRAELGTAAGSNDLVLKQLEIRALSGYVRDGMRILDVGCGNGITSIDIAQRHDVKIIGLDYAPKMIRAAKEHAADVSLKGSVQFEVGDVRDLPRAYGQFDMILTERVLINLPDWPAQQQAFREIISRLPAGGIYLMCESSRKGLDAINRLRSRVGLPHITPPWHNRYLVDDEVESLFSSDVFLETTDTFSSTYYFLSRVVNASLARQVGREPEYDAPVNQLALDLPAIGDTAQTKIWVWRKCGRSLDRNAGV